MKLWNIFDRPDGRTNNFCESWHSKYIRRTKVSHPILFRFIDFLCVYHNELIDNIKLIISDDIEKQRIKKRVVKLNHEIRIVKSKYNDGLICAEQLIIAASYWTIRNKKWLINFNNFDQ